MFYPHGFVTYYSYRHRYHCRILDTDNKMASTWIRMRLRYLGNVRLSRLITPVLLMMAVYFVFKWIKGPSLGIVRSKVEDIQHKMSQAEVQKYISALQDTRPQQCRLNYHNTLMEKKPKVSILVSFYNEEFYDLKLTLASILHHTAEDLYDEIVVLDDGTTQNNIQQHAAEFIKSEQFSKVKAYRSMTRHGDGITRFKASRVANGDFLIYVSSSTVVNVGWIEPLLMSLIENENRIVVPHADNFLSDHRFYQMDDNLVNTFTWGLSTVYTESSQQDRKYLKSAVMRGDVVATSKSFLDSIGNYDESMGLGAGQDLELSFRTWLCGGEILVSVCSRVAIHNALKPVNIEHDMAFRRINELWLLDYSDIVYKQTSFFRDIPGSDDRSLTPRKALLKKLHCKSFDWYLNTVAMDVIAPSEEMVYFGKLKAMSAYCARSLSASSNEVDLILCRPYMYDLSMMFEFTNKGYIRMGDRCLMASGSSSMVVLTDCQDDNTMQIWQLTAEERMTNQAFPNTCLSHVTDRGEAQTHVHYMQLSPCGEIGNPKQTWTYIKY